MSTTDPFGRITGAWMADGPTELPDRVLDRVFDEIHRHPRRRVRAPWRPTTMSLSFKLATAAVLVVAAIAAGSMLLGRGSAPSVGSSPSPTLAASPTAAASSAAPAPVELPSAGTVLEAATYTTTLVDPPLTLKLPCCFEVIANSESLMVIGENGLARYLIVTNPTSVVDPESGDAEPAPDDLVGWLEDHPGLAIDAATDVQIGGLAGRELEGEPGPDADFDVNGRLALTRGAVADSDVFLPTGHRFRVAALDGPDGLILIWTIARADVFEEFRATADTVLAGATFGEPGR